jgi:alkylated DNA repair dioxygenase AlkB
LLQAEFNHAVLNRYRDGGDHMGWHADDERELGQDPLIAALSLGAVRPFQLSPKRKRRTVRTLNLASGSLLVMGGALQHTWYHGVPVDRSASGERINLTFRKLLGPPGEVPDWRPPRRPPEESPTGSPAPRRAPR